MSRKNPFQAGEISLNELEDLLRKIDEDALTIPELHGFLSAVIVGPEPVMPTKWIPRVFSDEGEMPEFSSKDEAGRVMGGLFHLYNQIIRQMDEGTYRPVFGAKMRGKKDVPDPVPWCAGFDEGMSLTGDAWFADEDENLAPLLLPVFYFLDPKKFREISRTPSGRIKKGFVDGMVSGIADSVPALRDYWREKARGAGPRPARGVVLPFDKGGNKTAGRNDPCSCGSGKKYKYCCGRDGAG